MLDISVPDVQRRLRALDSGASDTVGALGLHLPEWPWLWQALQGFGIQMAAELPEGVRLRLRTVWHP